MDIPRPPRRQRWPRRLLLAGAGTVVAALAAGTLVQWRRDAAFAARPAPGSFVAVGDHRLHYELLGHGDLTFVLEAGLGDDSRSWGTLAAELARTGRVFVYDRAGLGWSDAGPRPRSPAQVAGELHDALEAAHVPKPYILVGHSWGGYTQMVFAERHPEGVAGLLLIDPSHPGQFHLLPGGPSRALSFTMAQLPRLAWSGLPQLIYRTPDPVRATSRYLESAGAEFRAVLAVAEAEATPLPRLGNLPVYVLSSGTMPGAAGEPADVTQTRHETWLALHEELLACSSSTIRRHLVVDGATHYIHVTNPEAVIAAARELTGRIKDSPAEAGARR
jgi:pimeloyl-ACP methyl ester carboxylesterase